MFEVDEDANAYLARTHTHPTPVHDSIIKQIEDLGYAVSTHRMCHYVEMHAAPLSGEGEAQACARPLSLL